MSSYKVSTTSVIRILNTVDSFKLRRHNQSSQVKSLRKTSTSCSPFWVTQRSVQMSFLRKRSPHGDDSDQLGSPHYLLEGPRQYPSAGHGHANSILGGHGLFFLACQAQVGIDVSVGGVLSQGGAHHSFFESNNSLP